MTMSLQPLQILGLLLVLVLTLGHAACASVPAGYQSVANAYQIPPEILYAIGLTESARRIDSTGNLRPWPWTLNVRGRGHFFASQQAARDALRRALDQGTTSLDIGLMQVNWRYHHDRLGRAQRALDPYHNLRVGAAILQECFRDRQDWWEAVGCYHAPNNAERAAGYRARVFKHWQRLTGHG